MTAFFYLVEFAMGLISLKYRMWFCFKSYSYYNLIGSHRSTGHRLSTISRYLTILIDYVLEDKHDKLKELKVFPIHYISNRRFSLCI